MAITDRIAFTPEHVAPEVLRNERDGPWTDVYGLASTLVTALTGTPPFAPRPGEPINAFLSRQVLAPPPTLPTWVPNAIAEPVTRALDPEPSSRPSVSSSDTSSQQPRHHSAGRRRRRRRRRPRPWAPPPPPYPRLSRAALAVRSAPTPARINAIAGGAGPTACCSSQRGASPCSPPH
jgi:hypothetical protein